MLFADVIIRKKKFGEDDNILSEQESKRILSVIARSPTDNEAIRIDRTASPPCGKVWGTGLYLSSE